MHPLRRSLLALPPATVVLAAALALSAARPSTRPPATTLSGRVVDAPSGAPLSSVQVYLRGTGIGALTDAEGRYHFALPEDRRLPKGELHLLAVLIGYAQADTVLGTAATLADREITIDFRLEQQPIVLSEIVVSRDATDAVRRSLPAAADAGASTATPPRAPAAPPPPLPAAAPRAELARAVGAGGPPPADPASRAWRGWRGAGEQYARIAENDFLSVVDEPRSTISIDVDRASYSNVRRFLRDGTPPPVDAVQIEEMVNYFAYDYALPHGDDPVAVTTELGPAPWAPRHRLLRVGLASRPVDLADMPPANLVFLLDVSGSMQSPDKLPLVKASLRLLVERLRARDRVAIVVYAGAAGLVLEPTPGSRKRTILDAIDRLEAGGSTAGGAGLRLAYDVAAECFLGEGNNRVILATDGDFNVGESSDGAMVRLIEEKRAQGTFLTVLGFGTGNLQSEKMQAIAQHGNGNYAYIDGLREARKVLVREMGGTLLTVAKDVKVQIEFNPARVATYRLLGYENRLLAARDFNDDAKDAGDLGAGHRVTALYELVPAGAATGRGGVDPLRYGAPTARVEADAPDELAFVKVRYKRPAGGASRLLQHPVRADGGTASTDLAFASAVAGFGMLLRDSEHAGALTAEDVLALAQDGLGEDPDGDRHEFVELVRTWRSLTAETPRRTPR